MTNAAWSEAPGIYSIELDTHSYPFLDSLNLPTSKNHVDFVKEPVGVPSKYEYNNFEIECPCSDPHVGKEYLNEVFNLSVDNLYECLFAQDSETMHTVFEQLKYEIITFTPCKKEEDNET